MADRDDRLAEKSLIFDAISAGGEVFRLSGTPAGVGTFSVAARPRARGLYRGG